MSRWSKSRALVTGVVVATLTGVLVATAPVSSAAVDSGLELEGDIADGAPAAPDWQSLFSDTGRSLDARARFFKDFTPGSTADSTTFATGSKDTLDITPGWQCKKSNNVTDKGDIQNTYMFAKRETNGDLVVYAGLEKNAPNGNNNMAVWLLQDGTVGCVAGGGNTAFTGSHVNGDVLLVAAFLNGGNTPVITAYEWQDGALVPVRNADGTAAVGGKCGTANSEDLCAVTNNSGPISTAPWTTQDKVLGVGTTLGEDQFYEMGANLTALDLNECFASYLANTRSSQELGATLYDFAGGQAQTCGSATVNKYIDVDKSGTSNTGDVTSGAAVTGWAMTVTGPAPATTTVCTGTTDSTGALVCATGSLANLVPGTYTVTETQKAGYYATDPGGTGTFNAATSPAKTFAVTTSGGSAVLGNTCFVDKTFRITGVPAGTTSLTAAWSKDSGDGTASSGTVTLTDAGNTTTGDGIWQGTLNDVLAQNAVIDWSWYANGDSAKQVEGAENELIGGGYPACAKLNTVAFPFATISGSKFEDLDGDGTKDTTEHALGGFHFKLMTTTTPSTQVGTTQTSAADGTFSFGNVAPGSYRVVEQTPPAGWVATNFPTGQPVTVDLGDTTKSTDPFGNWPLSRITVEFESLADMPGTTTDATKATAISCTDPGSAPGNAVGGTTGSNALTTDNLTLGQSQVTCTITFGHNTH